MCTLDETWEENSEVVLMENSAIGEYAEKFKRHYREEFNEDQLIRIAKTENLGIKAKMEKGRFLGLGKNILKCEKYSYIVKTEDGKLLKKRHYDIKAVNENSLVEDETIRLRQGMLGSEPLF
ncbi:hypothetical protein NGRA_2778 [Nosema granulosis]|uniref:Uncharacterized protein n=1 Tax=Nosema granulosis TaxID=83296 RepID=A0A9P6GW05_9MICR|nr:hypothetical protein NGRA_2778 [Nosema granulosis]